MTDVDDRDAISSQSSHDFEKPFGLATAQRTRRFVEDEHAHIPDERARDLDQLPLAGTELIDPRRRVDRRLAGIHSGQPLERGACQVTAPQTIDDPQALRLTAEQEVLFDAELRREIELLVDNRDSMLEGVDRSARGEDLAEEFELASIRTVDSREHLHQGALARAVLAEQCVDLAGVDLEVDAAQSLHRSKRLGDTAHLQRDARLAPIAHASTSSCRGSRDRVRANAASRLRSCWPW